MSHTRGVCGEDEDLEKLGYGESIDSPLLFGDPADEAARAMAQEAVRLALAQLPLREAEIIRCRYAVGYPAAMTQEEAAELLGISQGQVSKLEKSALKKLRSMLTDLEEQI